MIITTDGLKPRDLSQAKYLTCGDWASIYVEGDRVYRVFSKEDSTQEKLEQVWSGAKLQNSVDYAPKVYSVGKRTDGKIWVEMEYLKGYKPIHETNSCDRETILNLTKLLARDNISHNDINSGNILTKDNDIKLIDFDTASKGSASKLDKTLITRIANMYAA